MRHSFAALAAIAVIAAAAAQQAGAATRSCASVPLSEVKASLGIALTSAHPEATQSTPGLTACLYGTASNPQAVQLTFRTNGKAAYASDKKRAQMYAKSVSGIGTQAFYNSAGNPGTNGAVYVLKGNTELVIIAFAPLAKVESLAKKVASSL